MTTRSFWAGGHGDGDPAPSLFGGASRERAAGSPSWRRCPTASDRRLVCAITRCTGMALSPLVDEPQIGEVRWLGAMLAVGFVEDRVTLRPDSKVAERVVAAARQHGLLLIRTGVQANAVRFLPPLTVDDDAVREAAATFIASVTDVLPATRDRIAARSSVAAGS